MSTLQAFLLGGIGRMDAESCVFACALSQAHLIGLMKTLPSLTCDPRPLGVCLKFGFFMPSVKELEASCGRGSGSFEGRPAAERYRAAVAKRISELESELGVRLFERSTRRSHITRAAAFWCRWRKTGMVVRADRADSVSHLPHCV